MWLDSRKDGLRPCWVAGVGGYMSWSPFSPNCQQPWAQTCLEVPHEWHDLRPPKRHGAHGNHLSDAESALPERGGQPTHQQAPVPSRQAGLSPTD